MPIYEYICHECDFEFEELSKTLETADSVHCPSCKSKSVGRRLSVFAPRHGTRTKPSSASGPCGRCGDPSGPCST